MNGELKSIDEVQKTDDSDLIQLEKTALDAFFPQSKHMSLTQPSTPISLATTPSQQVLHDPPISKTAITAVILTVLYLVLSNGNVTRLVDKMVNSKHQVVSNTQILLGKIVLFAIISFLILYYYN